MRSDQLFPKPKRRMKEPRKDDLRQIIRNRDAEIHRLRGEIARTPRWIRAVLYQFQALRLRIQAIRLNRRGR